MLCLSNADPENIELAGLYWCTDADGAWSYTVQRIASSFGIPASHLPKVVGETATAFLTDLRCSSCGNPHAAKTRSDFAKIVAAVPAMCLNCAEIDRQQIRERAAIAANGMRERRNAIWLSETTQSSSFDYSYLGYLDAVYAFVILVASEFDEETGEVRLPDPETFSPDSEYLNVVIQRLHQEEVLHFGEKTPLDAFEPGDTDGTFRYYPSRISWRFATPESFNNSHESVFNVLSKIVDGGKTEYDYIPAICELWWHIGEAEGLRYLKNELDKYNIRIEEGDKLRDAIHYTLMRFSIPCLRYLMWKLAKDTAAYATRKDVHPRQAINSIPGALMRMCDRALADNWKISPWTLKWDEEESLLTTTLFDRILKSGVAGFKSITGEMIEAMNT